MNAAHYQMQDNHCRCQIRAAGCRRGRRGSAAHLRGVLALREKARINSLILPINLLRYIRICRRPPGSADTPRQSATFLFCFALLKKRYAYGHLPRLSQTPPHPAAIVLGECGRRCAFCPHTTVTRHFCLFQTNYRFHSKM